MKNKIFTILVLTVFFLGSKQGIAQETPLVLPLTADSLATGNYKDLLTSFFQLSFNRLIGPQKELSFNSNPFGVMARRNPKLLIDTSYVRYQHWRNLNFNFSVKLDDSYHFNGFSSGIKYAIINQRDETVSKAFVAAADLAQKKQGFTDLQTGLDAFASTITNLTDRKKFRANLTQFSRGEKNLNELDAGFQNTVKNIAQTQQIVITPDYNYYAAAQKTYDSLKTNFQNKLLWVVGITDTTLKDKFTFSNIVISTELLKGVVNPMAPVNVEIDVKAAMQFTHDSLTAGTNLNRSLLNIEPGLNLVLKSRRDMQSWAEFKLSGGYTRNFTPLYADEQRDLVTINGTLRVRVFDDIWIPVEIKYDPKTGNVLGLFNVKANFTGLGKLLKGFLPGFLKS